MVHDALKMMENCNLGPRDPKGKTEKVSNVFTLFAIFWLLFKELKKFVHDFIKGLTQAHKLMSLILTINYKKPVNGEVFSKNEKKGESEKEHSSVPEFVHLCRR